MELPGDPATRRWLAGQETCRDREPDPAGGDWIDVDSSAGDTSETQGPLRDYRGHGADVDLMLGRRRRRRPNIKSTSVRWLKFFRRTRKDLRWDCRQPRGRYRGAHPGRFLRPRGAGCLKRGRGESWRGADLPADATTRLDPDAGPKLAEWRPGWRTMARHWAVIPPCWHYGQWLLTPGDVILGDSRYPTSRCTGTRRCCDVESTSMTLIQRRNNVVCLVGSRHSAGSAADHRRQDRADVRPTAGVLWVPRKKKQWTLKRFIPTL